jgi:pimeloyl-ACP methyl ester carboxylesterase
MAECGEDWRAYPLILLSGMGADERVFLPQLKVFSNLVVPKWIDPEAHESLRHYAERMAARVDPHGPCFIGGASFGGMLAIEMARYLDSKCCFLIGSVASPREFPFWLALLRGAPAVAHMFPFGLMVKGSSLLLRKWGNLISPYFRGFLEQIAQADPRFLEWATGALLRWKPPAELAIPIYRIHGAKDRVLPMRTSKGIEMISDGGHLVSLSHGPKVNRFLQEKMELHRVNHD